MPQVRSIFKHDLCDRVREITLLAARHKILNKHCGTVFLRNDEHARESSAVRSSTDERYLPRLFELHVLWNPNKNSRLQKRRVQRSQAVVVIARVAREVLANDLVVSRIRNSTE